MGIIFQIALRNLREHKIKSIIICSLIALGMFLLVLGNSIIDTGKIGIRKSFIQSFTGDILVGPLDKDKKKPALFKSGGGNPFAEATPTVPEYQQVYDYLQTVKNINHVDPQIYGALQIEINDDWRAFVGFFGVDIQAYNTMFPNNIELVQGHFLADGEEGIMLPEKIYNEIKDKVKVEYNAGKIAKMVGFGSGTKIKNLPIVGVFHFKSNNTVLEQVGFMDISSLRYMLGMVVGAASQIKVDAKAENMMDASLDNLDSFYGADSVVSTSSSGSSSTLSAAKLDNILGDTSKRAEMAMADSGAWHYLLLRVNEGVDPTAVITELNKHFKDQGQNLVAVDWEDASGAVAQVARVAQWVFLVLVIIISVVSIFVIMNTMVVSIVERTAEIGTMRALGAQRNYIRQIFMTETFTLSMVGGLIGLLVAMALITLLHSVGLPAPQAMFEIVFGGKVLYPVLSWMSAAQALVIMVLVGLLSSIYPTAMALRISPVKAMQSN